MSSCSVTQHSAALDGLLLLGALSSQGAGLPKGSDGRGSAPQPHMPPSPRLMLPLASSPLTPVPGTDLSFWAGAEAEAALGLPWLGNCPADRFSVSCSCSFETARIAFWTLIFHFPPCLWGACLALVGFMPALQAALLSSGTSARGHCPTHAVVSPALGLHTAARRGSALTFPPSALCAPCISCQLLPPTCS